MALMDWLWNASKRRRKEICKRSTIPLLEQLESRDLLAADLTTATANIHTTTYDPGDTLNFDLTIKNIGNSNSNSGRVYYYFRQGALTYSSSYNVGNDFVPRLGSNGTSVESFTYQISSSASAGTWYFSYWIDATGTTTENSENNNRGWWAITVRSQDPPGVPGTPNLSRSHDTGVSDTDNITSRTSGLTFTWPSGSDATSYEYEWDDETPNNFVSGTLVTVDAPSGTGWREFWVRSVNSFGKSTAVKLDVYIDGDGPNVSDLDLDSGDDSGFSQTDNITRDRTVEFDWSNLGSLLDHYEYGFSLGNLTTTQNTSVATTLPSSDGTYTFYVKAVAKSGLEDTANLQVVYDTSGPESTAPTAPVGVITTLTPDIRWPYNSATDWKFRVDLQVDNGSGWVQAPGFSSPLTAVRTDGLRVSEQLSFGKPYQTRIATYDIAGNVGDFGPWHEFNTAQPDIEVVGAGNVIVDGDTTPRSEDGTNFGPVAVLGTPFTSMFTVKNTGAVTLTLGGSPRVRIDGTHKDDFEVTKQPGASIAAGGATTFDVTFTPSAAGLRTATLTIESDDPDDEDPYTFDIVGTGFLAPQIQVLGNGQAIANGDDSPSSDDDTDFGPVEISGGRERKTFTIRNNGSESLRLTGGLERVEISGHTDDFFLVGGNPQSPIDPNGGTSTFQIEFDARATGQRSATVSIPNSDDNNNPFVFTLTGTGVRSSVVSGPRVTLAGPPVKDLRAGTIDHIILRFDKPINSTTLTSSDVAIDHNGSDVPVTSVRRLNNKAYRADFAPQSAPGIYRIVLSPTVAASAGQLLNQDGDAFNGEAVDDQFVRLVELVSTTTVARSATLTSPNSGSWNAGEIIRIQGYPSDSTDVDYTVIELFNDGTEAEHRVGDIYRGAPGSGVKSSHGWEVVNNLEGLPIEGSQYRIGLTFVYTDGASSTTYSSGNLILNSAADPTPPTPMDFDATLTSAPGSRTAEVTLEFAPVVSASYEIQRSSNKTFWKTLAGIGIAEASSGGGLVAQDTFRVDSAAQWFYRIWSWFGQSRSDDAAEDAIQVLEPTIPAATLEVRAGGPQPEVEVNETYRVDLRSFIDPKDSSGADVGQIGYDFVTNVDGLPIREVRPRLTGAGLLELTPTSTTPFVISILATAEGGATATLELNFAATDEESTITPTEKVQQIEDSFDSMFRPVTVTGTGNNKTVTFADQNFTYTAGEQLTDSLEQDQNYQDATDDYKLFALRQLEYATNPAMLSWVKGELWFGSLVGFTNVAAEDVDARRTAISTLRESTSDSAIVEQIDSAFRLIRPHSGWLQCTGGCGAIENGSPAAPVYYSIDDGVLSHRTTNAAVGYIENNGSFSTAVENPPTELAFNGEDRSTFAELEVGVELFAWNNAGAGRGDRSLQFGHAVPSNFVNNTRVAPILSERILQLVVAARRSGIDIRVSSRQGYRTPYQQENLSENVTGSAAWKSFHQYGVAVDFAMMTGFPIYFTPDPSDPNANIHPDRHRQSSTTEEIRRVGQLSQAERIELFGNDGGTDIWDWGIEHIHQDEQLHFNWPGLESRVNTNDSHHLFFDHSGSESNSKVTLALQYHRHTNPEATTDRDFIADQSIIGNPTWKATPEALSSVWELIGATDSEPNAGRELTLDSNEVGTGAISFLNDADFVQIDIDDTELQFGQSLSVELEGLSGSRLRLLDPFGVEVEFEQSVPDNSSFAGGFSGFESSRFERSSTVFFVPENAGTYTLEVQGTGLNTGSYSVAYGQSASPSGDDWRANSDFLLGDVAVNVVFFDSDGTLDADLSDWSAADITGAKNEITQGLGWWVDALANANSVHSLNFNIDFTRADVPFETRIESSTRNLADAALAIDDFRIAAGFDTTARNTFFDRYFDLSEHNQSIRESANADWATTIFVFKDDFVEGSAAWAEQGGPWIVLAGPDAIKKEYVAHEFGHIFHALDEYAGGHDYDANSGVYGTQNVNAADGHPDSGSREVSIMDDVFAAWDDHRISDSAAAMLGWQDSDNDGIFDALDVPLSLQGVGTYHVNLAQYRFEGYSEAVPLNNLNPHPFNNVATTTNTVDRVQYRLNGGSWTTAASYGVKTTTIDFVIDGLAPGDYAIEVRTVDDEAGVVSNKISDSFQILATPVLNSPSGTINDATPTFTWQAVAGQDLTYELWVYHVNTATHKIVYANGWDGTSFTQGTDNNGPELEFGSYQFWVRAHGLNSLISPWSETGYFVIGEQLVAPTLVSPSGTIGDAAPDFVWNDVSGADTFEVSVYSVTTNTHNVIHEVVAKADACSAGSCTMPAGATLPAGDYRFWVRPIDAGNTHGPWSSGLDFQVGTVPGVPTVIGPSGNTFNPTPIFSWEVVPDASTYELSVYNQTTNTHNVIHRSDLTLPTHTPEPEDALPSGHYQFWVRAKSTDGFWGGWSPATYFSVGIPDIPVLIGPSGNIVETKPLFQWNPTTGAERFELWVYDFTTGEHQVIHDTNIIDTTTNSYMSDTALEAGHTYWFWLRAFNDDGLPGEWSDRFEFTIL